MVQISYPGEYKEYQIENISGMISLNRETDICTYMGALTCGGKKLKRIILNILSHLYKIRGNVICTEKEVVRQVMGEWVE